MIRDSNTRRLPSMCPRHTSAWPNPRRACQPAQRYSYPGSPFGPEVPIMVLIREWVAQGPISTDLSTYPPRAAAA